MTLNIVIMITIFSIIGEHKVDGNEYANLYKLASKFKVEAFAEFNIVCYEAIYTCIDKPKLRQIIFNPGWILSKCLLNQVDITSMSVMLYHLNNWPKVNVDGELETKFVRCNPTRCTAEELKLQYEFALTFLNAELNIFKSNIKTPIGLQFIQLDSKIPLSIEKLYPSLKICKKTLNTFSTKTKILDCPKKSVFGYIVLLMSQNEIKRFHEDSLKDIDVYNIMKNALQDIFVGLASSLDGMNDVHLINIYLLRIIDNIVINDVIDLSQKLYLTSYYHYKINEEANEETLTKIQNYYMELINYFKYKWQKTLAQLDNNIPKTREIDEEFKTTNRLFKNNKIEPSIIGYYAAYMNSLEDTTILEYNNTDKDKILFLMEINAWTKILLQQPTEQEKNIEGIPKDVQNHVDSKKHMKEIHELFKETQLK